MHHKYVNSSPEEVLQNCILTNVWSKSSSKSINSETIASGAVQSYTIGNTGTYVAIVTSTGWYAHHVIKINDVILDPVQIQTPYNNTRATVTKSRKSYTLQLNAGDVIKFCAVTMGHTDGTTYNTTSTITLLSVTSS